ncbi:small ribosomal subunit protein uS9m [Elaeis guineensis]|uniref:30S ribosomal protein S9, mitochondrial n=1 Tax=Elaeis guineensis var. tenera TaxID=51953 RepID=A0A6I9S4N7_ELAGV|nr:30S ribosomal protein S9, mitochondrial [Elaeis guineensis]
MLSGLISRPLHLRLPLRLLTLTLVSSPHHLFSSSSSPPVRPPPPPLFPLRDPNPSFYPQSLRTFSTNRGDEGRGNGDGTWKFSPENDEVDSVFGEEEGSLAGIAEGGEDVFGSEATAGAGLKGGDPWSQDSTLEKKGDIFGEIDREFASKEEVGGGGEDEWETAEGYKPWTLGEEEEKEGLFDAGGEGELGIEGIGDGRIEDLEKERIEEQKQLEKKEQELLATLKGPNRAFGDLIAASGITEDMIDSLILLKDVRGIKGLPPLHEIEDKAIARMNATSTRAEIERKKQEEIAKARVRQVDEKGRAYGTGRRKCSVARVWIQPGDGKFIVNDKQFDAYFPILDHRAELLRPFTVTKTLGLWDVNCTVKGGGVSGQVGAIRLGISRALQNWEPGLRPYLKAAGYLTRDPRVVERKKPGKAKARKSFQWVKR